MSDLLHYYRLDIRDLFSDANPLSPRYLLSLIKHLPTDGAFFAARQGGQEFRGWDTDRYALVSLVNAQRAGNHILMMVNRDPKRPKPKPPEPFPIPGDDVKKKTLKPGSFAAIAASMLEAQRRKKELMDGNS